VLYFFSEILGATSIARPRADVAYCIHALARRLAKTRNWTVHDFMSKYIFVSSLVPSETWCSVPIIIFFFLVVFVCFQCQCQTKIKFSLVQYFSLSMGI
jgi:hypothetical protein